MSGKCTRAALAALIVAAAAATMLAQGGSSDVYRSAVGAYVAGGDISRAVQPLQNWKLQQFEEAIRETLASNDRARIMAAAIFQLEIGVALAGLSSASSRMHIELGADLLEKGRLPSDAKGDYAALRLSWHVVAASVFVATKDLIVARPLVEKARELGSQSPRVQTLMGSYYEADATLLNPEDSQSLTQRERLKRERLISLVRAEGHYRDALRHDEHYPRALIRLGRVLHLSNRLPEAKTFLERGIAEAKLPPEKYLGALFMGAMQVEQNDLASARESYERALAITPTSQTAVVALGHLEVMSGRPDRAQLLARRFVDTPPEPWWGYKDGLFDMTGLQALRAAVVRR